jgi:4-amino-4-deoxychorismate lyase
MSLLFETIKVVNNTIINIDYHNERVNQSRQQLLNACDKWDLNTIIAIPELKPDQVYKCKIIYSEKPVSIKFYPYVIKPLRTLKLVDCSNIDYRYKYFDRSDLEILKLSNDQADDIIIVQHRRITDCSYANIVFYDGAKWVTPAIPLLKGTKRQQYIDNQLILERDITISDLQYFTNARIINAMIDLEESPDILMENIF